MPSADRIRKAEAVIITHKDFGEADRIIRFFSLEYGKMSALAKGVRKIRSRKGPHLEPFTHASLMLAKGQSFWIITQAETRSGFQGIREDLRKTARAAYVLELADKLTSEEQTDARVFRLILETLARIDGSERVMNAVLFFELRMLDLAGFKPEFFHCVNCNKEILPQDQFFSIHQGGVICPDCAMFSRSQTTVAKDTLRYLRHFQRSTYKQLETIVIDDQVSEEIYRIMKPYIAQVAERQLNSSEFLNQISQFKAKSNENDIK